MAGLVVGLDWGAVATLAAAESGADREMLDHCLAEAETGMLAGLALARETGRNDV